MRKIARAMLMRDRIGGEAESRYSDGRGREHYDNGRYAPMRNEYGSEAYNGGYDVENRFQDRDGRKHYDNGRYAAQSRMYENTTGAYNYNANMNGGQQAYSRYDAQSNYARMNNSQPQNNGQEGEPSMNMIGFRIDGEANMQPKHEYDPKRESYISFPRGDEMSNRGGKMEKGLGQSEEAPELTKEVAEKWVKSMQNSDGSHGAHWPMEQTTAILEQRGYAFDPAEFYVVMNMMYSDYHNVFQRYGVETPEFYADMARAWLDDPDAKKDKTAEYFCHVVKH